jgi:hypothetical protein
MNYIGKLYGKMGRRTIPLVLTSEDVDRIEKERDNLAAWKAGHLKVNEWWTEIDRIVREHPDTIIGRTVADEAVRMIQERDKFLSLLKRAESFMRHGLNCPARIGEGHACECGMLDAWKEVRHV